MRVLSEFQGQDVWFEKKYWGKASGRWWHKREPWSIGLGRERTEKGMLVGREEEQKQGKGIMWSLPTFYQPRENETLSKRSWVLWCEWSLVVPHMNVGYNSQFVHLNAREKCKTEVQSEINLDYIGKSTNLPGKLFLYSLFKKYVPISISFMQIHNSKWL